MIIRLIFKSSLFSTVRSLVGPDHDFIYGFPPLRGLERLLGVEMPYRQKERYPEVVGDIEGISHTVVIKAVHRMRIKTEAFSREHERHGEKPGVLAGKGLFFLIISAINGFAGI